MRLFDVVGALVVASWVALASAYAITIHSKNSAQGSSILSDKVTMLEGESWMILTRKDADVGFIHETRTVVDDGWLLEYEMLTLVELMGVPQLIDTRMKATVDRDAILRQFFGSVNSVIGDLSVRGEVKGLELTMTMDLQGKQTQQKLTLRQPPRLASNALNQILAGPAPKVGQVFEQEFFDPVSMGMNKLVYEFVEMKEVDSYDVKSMSFHFVQKVMGTELDVYVNKDGELLIQELPMYTIAAKIPNELGRARAPVIRRDIEKRMKDSKIRTPDDLMKQIEQQAGAQGAAPTQSGLMSNALDFVGSAFGASSRADEPIAYTLGGLSQDLPLMLESERQRLRAPGDAWPPVVLVGSFAEESHREGVRAWSQPAVDTAPLLAASATLDLADPAIIKLAQSAGDVGAAEAARALARKVGAAVQRADEATPADARASALLAAGKADARGQALVLVAALRARKIPARFIVGLLREADGQTRGHVWVQAWDGERFIDLDPSREDFVPGQGHVQLGALDALDAPLADGPFAPILSLKLEPAAP